MAELSVQVANNTTAVSQLVQQHATRCDVAVTASNRSSETW